MLKPVADYRDRRSKQDRTTPAGKLDLRDINQLANVYLEHEPVTKHPNQGKPGAPVCVPSVVP